MKNLTWNSPFILSLCSYCGAVYAGSLRFQNHQAMKTFDTLSEALSAMEEKGYRHDFSLSSERLECADLSLALHPEDFHVDAVYRFEGMSSTDDNSVLYAISSRDGVKGILVDAYGVYAEHISEAMRRKLR